MVTGAVIGLAAHEKLCDFKKLRYRVPRERSLNDIIETINFIADVIVSLKWCTIHLSNELNTHTHSFTQNDKNGDLVG